MSARKYTHIVEQEEGILAMWEAGATRQEIAARFGLSKEQIKRGNCYDNAMSENFLSILKTECIYRHKPASFEQANDMIVRFIYFYNHERIQLKTGEAPLARRLSTESLLFPSRGLFYTVHTIWGCSSFGVGFCLQAVKRFGP